MSKIIAELDFIARRIVQDGNELPSFATLGVDAWKELCVDLDSRARHSVGTGTRPGISPFIGVDAYLSVGSIKIKPSTNVAPNLIAIGRMTKNDIIIDDILLGDNDCTKDLDLSTDI